MRLDLKSASEGQLDRLALASFIIYELDIDDFDELLLERSPAQVLQELGLSYAAFQQFKRGWLALRDLLGYPKQMEILHAR